VEVVLTPGPEPKLPPLSVVVPSHQGEALLPRLAEALLPQLAPGDEAILVDDGSTDGTAERAAALGFRVERLDRNRGAGRARNEGSRAAKNDVLVFLDDDVLPAPDYLARVREAFADPAVECCQGAHALEPANPDPDLWQRAEAILWRHTMATACVGPDGCTVVASQAFNVRREAFLAAGGFREGFVGAPQAWRDGPNWRHVGGEEFDLTPRLLARTRIDFRPELVTRHHYQPALRRLRTLFGRARSYRTLYAGMPPRSRRAFLPVVLRCALVAAAPLLLAAGFAWPPAWLLLAGAGLLLVLLDVRLLVDCARWGRLLWFPWLEVQSFLKYLAIALGVLRGLGSRAPRDARLTGGA
jgi:glycosyltransferase involved in cell wall biosynthesis